MTQAQWLASIPAAGTLTVDGCPTHCAQALQDGDAQLVANILGGSAVTPGQLNSRAELLSLFSLYTSASLSGPGTVLTVQARNVLTSAGSNYYNVTGAP